MAGPPQPIKDLLNSSKINTSIKNQSIGNNNKLLDFDVLNYL